MSSYIGEALCQVLNVNCLYNAYEEATVIITISQTRKLRLKELNNLPNNSQP